MGGVLELARGGAVPKAPLESVRGVSTRDVGAEVHSQRRQAAAGHDRGGDGRRLVVAYDDDDRICAFVTVLVGDGHGGSVGSAGFENV